MFRRNSDVRLRDLERQITQGDMSAMPNYLQELIRTGQMSSNTLELAAILEYEPAQEIIRTDETFCEIGFSHPKRGELASLWHSITWERGLTPLLLVFMGDWFLNHISGPSSDIYFSTIQNLIPRFQEAYTNRTYVNGYDGGFLQELAYGSEGMVTYKGKEYKKGSTAFCDALVADFNARRAQSKKTGKKTTPIMTAVSSGIGSQVKKVLKEAEKKHQGAMKKSKADLNAQIAKMEKLNKSYKEFLNDFKALAGDSFSAKAVDKAFKEIELYINTIKKKYESKK